MRRAAVLASLAVAAVLAPTVAVADDTPEDIVKRVDDKPGDKAAAEQGLTEIEAYVAKHPDDAIGEYARGMILSKLEKKSEAVVAYDRSAKLDPTLADAYYNAGVILLDLERADAAIEHFKSALAADPKHEDAAYNLGQTYYNRKKYADALTAWQTARSINPDDFGAAKKVLQAYNALGKTADAAKARAEVIALWKASKDDSVKQLTQFVFDQFDAAGWHVYAYETFEPSGDTYSLYTFQLADPQDYPKGQISVDWSKTGYIAVSEIKDQPPKVLKLKWKKLPAYKKLKAQIGKAVKAEFGAYKK